MAGALVLDAAFQHNPQGEFHTLGAVNLGPTGALFLLTAIPVMVIVFLVELTIHGIARPLSLGNETRLPIVLLPGLDAIVLGLLLAAWDSYDSQSQFAVSKRTVIIASVVFCVELIVQHIARSVRRAQANARANRIEP